MAFKQSRSILSKHWSMSTLSPGAAAEMKQSIDRGPVRFIALHMLGWGLGGSLLRGGLHALSAHGLFLREASQAFVPYCLFGLLLGLINWNLRLFGYAKYCSSGQGPVEAKLSEQGSVDVIVHGGISSRRAGTTLIVLVGAFLAWLPLELWFHRVDDRLEHAVRAGTVSEVQTEARWVIATAWTHPLGSGAANALHHSHVALGLLALEEEDVASAREHLLDAGRSNGSPNMDTFGPNMALANALLERGERDVVLAYFDECRDFWRMDRGRLDKWSAQVVAGVVPDFGANMVF